MPAAPWRWPRRARSSGRHACPTPRRCCVRCRGSSDRTSYAAHRHFRPPARPRAANRRLCLCTALQLPHGTLRCRAADADPRGRPRLFLLPSAGERRMNDLLRISDLVVEYPVGGGRRVHASQRRDASLVRTGETLGLVGESGSGNRRRWPARCCSCRRRRAAASCSTATNSPSCEGRRCAPCDRGCR